MTNKTKGTLTLAGWYILLFALLTALALCTSSCSTVKKDCRGVKHYKQKGGFYL